MKAHAVLSPRTQSGAAAVEFALIASLLFLLLFGIIEFARLSFYWNTATEATRLGARLAVVCTMDDAAIKARMRTVFPLLAANQIDVEYLPTGCSATTCAQVRVAITDTAPIQTFIPFIDVAATLPPFATTLPRESMSSTGNPVCM